MKTVMAFLMMLVWFPEAAGAGGPPGATVQESSAPRTRSLAVGYKAAPGLGMFGADVIWAPTARVSFPLAAFLIYDGGPKGLALAPSVRLDLSDGHRSSFFVSGGMLYVRRSLGEVTGDGFGWITTVGYEWNWRRGLALQVGLGLHGREPITGRRGVVSITQRGFVGPHLDTGLRYWF